jgi:hypothetical protein
MKLSIFILSLVLIISTSPRLNAQETEEDTKLYTDNMLKRDFCGYDSKKGINGETVKWLETYIEPTTVLKADGTPEMKDGKPIEIKGSLTVNEDGAHLGERVFNFEKLQADIVAEANPAKKECLRSLFRLGVYEWQTYYNNLSKKYECGVELKNDDKICGYKKSANKYTCEDNNDNSLPDGMVEESARTSELLTLVPGEKKNTCTKTADGEDLAEHITDRLKYIADFSNNLHNKELRNNTLAYENADKPQSEAGICPDGRDCGAKNAEQKAAEVAQKTEEQLCCDSISENWVPLGFATIKGSTPSPKICKDMFDKDKVGEDKSFIKQCIKNITSAFASSAVNSFLDFFSTGWITNIPILLKELATNFSETIEKIGSEMIGLDRKLLACVNENTRHELYCSMAGKFIGANAGFGIAMGGVGGAAVSALTKAAKFTVGKTKTTNSLVNKLAKSPSASKGILKSAGSGAAKGLKTGILWPVKLTSLAWKGTLTTIKGVRKIPSVVGNTAAAAVTGTLGATAKGAAKVLPKDGLSPASNLGNAFSQVGDALFTSTKSSVDNIIKGSANAKVLKELKGLETQAQAKAAELSATVKKHSELSAGIEKTPKGKNRSTKENNAKIKEADEFSKKMAKEAEELQALEQKIKETKASAYKKHLIDEQRLEFQNNVDRIRAINNQNVQLRKQIADQKTTQAQREAHLEQLKQNSSAAAKLKVQNEAVKKKIQETVDTKISTIENNIFNGVTATGTALGTGAIQVEKMKGTGKQPEGQKPSGEADKPKKVEEIPVPTAPPPGVAAPVQAVPTPTTKKEEPQPKATVTPSAKQTEPAQTESGESKAASGTKEFAPPPPMD